jgi:asparagine synthetase B (glutamine-hydrolysing)
MAESWLLRWDTFQAEVPEVICSADDRTDSVADFAGTPGSFVAFDGYLFDREKFQTGPKATDAARVVAAYARWGEDLFGELQGGFTLAVWDHPRRCLVAGRDAMGLHPCYYWWHGGLFILSPSLELLLAQPEVSGKFNRLLIAEFLQLQRPSYHRSETFFEDVSRLPPAHHLSLRDGSVAVTRYWDPLPPGFSWATRDERETFEPALERAVDRCLSVGADSLALSGGFDSVSIAVLAAQQRDGKNPIHALSLLFPQNLSGEGVTQVAVARALGMPHICHSVEGSWDGFTILQDALAISKISPCPVQSKWQGLYTGLLELAAGRGLNRMLMGTGGDEMLTVDFSYGFDLFTAFNLRGLWRFYRAMARTTSDPALWDARVVLWDGAIKPGILNWLSSGLERYAPQLKKFLRTKRKPFTPAPWISHSDPVFIQALEHRRLTSAPVEIAPGEGQYVRAIRRLPMSPLLMMEMEQGGAWAKSAGFSLLYPYFDRDLVELLLRVHPEHLIAGGRVKTPLRRLVAERLPSVDLPAEKIDFTHVAHGILRTGGQATWHNMQGLSILAELGIIEYDRLDSVMETYFAGHSNNWVRTWLVLSTEAWLRARSN